MKFLLCIVLSLFILGAESSMAQTKDKAKYKQYKTEGDTYLQQGALLKAKEAYTTALNNKPNDKYVTAQLATVTTSIETKYKETIALADQKFGKGDYQAAQSKYEEALTFKPNDSYAKSQIGACNVDLSGTFVKNFGGRSYDEARAVIQTKDGGVVIAGRSSPSTSSNTDMIILKLDRDGNKVWETKIGGDETDEAKDVIETADGNIIAVGHSDSYNGQPGMKDMWAVKVDGNGSEVWNKTFGSDMSIDEASAVVETESGFLLVGNSFVESSLDIKALMIDKDGEKVWEKTYGGAASEEGSDVISTEEGFVIVGNTESKGKGKWDIWLLSIDKEGNQQWDMTYGGGDNETGNSVIQTTDGGLLIAGSTYSFAYASQDFWLIKTDNKGKEEWNKAVGALAAEEAFTVKETKEGSFLAVGFQEIWNEEEQAVSSKGYDIFMVSLDPKGEKLWERNIGGDSDQRGFDALIMEDGGIIVVGMTKIDPKQGVDILVIRANSSGMVAPVK
ncbi:hypothetical protein R9C00_22550 [Flammeovirgaceae bacterium SG7u.111]|nr:hypothetical protein [Flammeovirgaceae bacterium SG7u.132]WPO34484.1 hypothetical protein R9C00_22550 [Flammeovirgaceae bacterium SG7u.111]